MNRYRLTLIAALFVFTAAGSALPEVKGRQSSADQQRGKVTTLYYYLDQLGTEYDCFFTIEASWDEEEVTRWMESYKLERSSKKENLSVELEALSRAVPHLTYTVDKNNPKIIHVTDARLVPKRDYALERTVGNIDFTGTLPDLVNSISQQGIPLSTAVAVFTSDFRPRDQITEVRVKGEGLKVRDFLTDFIPLEGHGRVLWVARTKLGQLETTYLQFYGPAKAQ